VLSAVFLAACPSPGRGEHLEDDNRRQHHHRDLYRPVTDECPVLFHPDTQGLSLVIIVASTRSGKIDGSRSPRRRHGGVATESQRAGACGPG
jgi:hypothetical protein